jgi:hypothetical protein
MHVGNFEFWISDFGLVGESNAGAGSSFAEAATEDKLVGAVAD